MRRTRSGAPRGVASLAVTTAVALADELGLSEGDVLVFLAGSAPDDAVPDELAVEVLVLLDPDGTRRAAG